MWQYESEGETHDMFMDLEEDVRFRVVQEIFVDTLPTDGELNSALYSKIPHVSSHKYEVLSSFLYNTKAKSLHCNFVPECLLYH